MGIFDDDDLEFIEQARREANEFKPQELNEANVQAIFRRCLAEEDDGKTTMWATLFPPEPGYEYDPDAQVLFQTDALLQNKKNIEYLYGQLKEVHDETPVRRVSFWDFSVMYSGKQWTQEEQAVLQLLYLGVNYHLLLIEPFWAKNDTSRIFKEKPVKPTLSPKDPAFPAWWEEHRAEWEG